ncbi:MAG: cytochrome c oxidase assembly protein [Acidiferrobacterales bacterium]|nr:cytochrome c oxidase assembly protein [Acidiferrobacterales bacterium]
MAQESNRSVEDLDAEHSLSRGSLVRRLIVIALIMFGFGYALVPLYEVFCRVTGFGGKTDIIQEAAANKALLIDRDVEVTFTSHSHTALPWEFKPITKAMTVKVGEIQDAVFYVKNYSNRPITGMATFNVTPPRAGFYFKKTECFCFTKQVLQPGEEQEMAVRFLLDSEMPDDVHELTLSYTFFDNEKHAGQ